MLALHEPLTLIHGAARSGADAMAQSWALDRRHQNSYAAVIPEPHPAEWKTHGRSAGFIRNAEMVKLGADACLAFLIPCGKKNCRFPQPHDSHGAQHCAGLAEQAGITVTRIRDDAPVGRQ